MRHTFLQPDRCCCAEECCLGGSVPLSAFGPSFGLAVSFSGRSAGMASVDLDVLRAGMGAVTASSSKDCTTGARLHLACLGLHQLCESLPGSCEVVPGLSGVDTQQSKCLRWRQAKLCAQALGSTLSLSEDFWCICEGQQCQIVALVRCRGQLVCHIA